MKKLFLIMFLLIPFSMQGQEIKFMGLEFGTNIEAFCNALKTKGLKQIVDRFEEQEFVGTFATYNNCNIIVKATEVTKRVKSVEVQFNSVRNKEYERDRAYEEILKQYKNKYGSKLILKDKKDSLMGIEKYIVDNGKIVIEISICGPGMLSKDCFLNVYYYSKELLHNNKEVNSQKYSNDI